VPRPETEQLVDLALAFLKNKPNPKILDLGTGTGAIPISILANNPAATAVAVDLSPEALVAARTNAALHSVGDRLETRAGSWFDPIASDEKFDIILSNPPYIETEIIAGLAADVRDHDPMLALDGGADGLVAYRTIASEAHNHLAEDGILLLEIGSGQGESVSQLLKDAGFTTPAVEKDLAGLDRVVVTHHVRDK
jgi:release factor glutamine methyltransferase